LKSTVFSHPLCDDISFGYSQMAIYRFYQIKSLKSQEYRNGLRQVTLNCENHPQIYCFVWINKTEEPEHIQFVFNENIIEWFKERGISIGQTNRKMYDYPAKSGIQKGSRTIHASYNTSIMDEGIDIIKDSEFPEDFQHTIQAKITNLQSG